MSTVELPESFTTRFAATVAASRGARQNVRAERAAGEDPETDPARRAAFADRRAAAVVPERRGAEAIVGTDDLQASWFLSGGAQVRRAIGFVQTIQGAKVTQGSGFLVSPRLFLTNQHVLENEDAARNARVTFDYEITERGQLSATTVFRLDPDRCAVFSPLDQLDYALIALGQRESGNATLEELGYLILSDRPDKHKIGMNVNIIEHPQGLPKMIAVRNNLLEFRTDTTLLYQTDTQEGSSGSPVLNDEWEVVALHHYGAPFVSHVDDQGRQIVENVNEGLRISAIYKDLGAKVPQISTSAGKLVLEALAYDKTRAAPAGRRLSPPRPAPESNVLSAAMNGGPPMNPSDPAALTLTVPLEISIRLGTSGMPVSAAVLAPPGDSVAPIPAKRLVARSEAVVLDQDYTNREGYDPAFITGVRLPIPVPTGDVKMQVLAVDGDQGGELKYTHYSIVLNEPKRMALLTATNIDGTSFRKVNRATGQVADASEGDRWFVDPRIAATAVLGQDFYSGWSDYFDRGHLTRREDTNWGKTDAESERGNADTFHFTNCSPQHFRFNESTQYWQGAERYVLENGTLQDGDANRLCVYQGPIFDDRRDRMADDVQIPSRFFKLIVWRGHDGQLKSVGLIVDQSALLDESRVKFGPPHDVARVNIQQFRVAVNEIERDTGLDFGNDIRDADTFELKAQPQVGEAQAAILLRSQTDVLPAAARSQAANGLPVAPAVT